MESNFKMYILLTISYISYLNYGTVFCMCYSSNIYKLGSPNILIRLISFPYPIMAAHHILTPYADSYIAGTQPVINFVNIYFLNYKLTVHSSWTKYSFFYLLRNRIVFFNLSYVFRNFINYSRLQILYW